MIVENNHVLPEGGEYEESGRRHTWEAGNGMVKETLPVL